MIKLIKNGEVYAPEKLGKCSILLINNKIIKIGQFHEKNLDSIGLEYEVIDAQNSIITPGFIDPHVHIIGGGGEGGFSTRTPEIQLSDIVQSGITTVIGLLGTDSTTRHLTSLLAKSRALEEEGITSYIYTGNYAIPTPTITGSIKDDIILIEKAIGVAEIAISDSRSGQPSVHELAKVVSESRVGGLLSGKAGVTHFHTGPGKDYLSLLHKLLDDYEIPPLNLYATHITRSKELVDDAIQLAKRGSYVDMTADDSTGEWIKYYKKQGGNLNRLTLSSDGNGSLPKFDESGNLVGFDVASTNTLYEQFVSSIKDYGMSLEEVLPLVTSNTSDVLKLKYKGRIKEQNDADLVIMNKSSLGIRDVIAKGVHVLKGDKIMVKGTFEN